MMNPLHSDDLFFQVSFLNPSSNSLPIQTIPEDQILHDPVKDESCPPYKSTEVTTGKGKQKQKRFSAKVTKDENQRWMHREIERQRRQEMATLCASLRSLLPLEYIKGKRSASDHMYEAVNYIKHLKNKVKQLEGKRDELKKLCNLSSISVIVHPYKGGAEIVCSYSFKKYVFTHSQLLSLLLQEGLNVVNCNFTKTDERFIHTIRFEDSGMAEVSDYSELRRKLTQAILSTSK